MCHHVSPVTLESVGQGTSFPSALPVWETAFSYRGAFPFPTRFLLAKLRDYDLVDVMGTGSFFLTERLAFHS
jgi:hypothetical protein